MTTTAFDLSAKLLTSDSRWSACTDDGTAIAYLDDDVGFDKIECAHGNAFLFAGNSQVIDAWKNFLRSGPLSAEGRPQIAGIALLVAEMASGAVIYAYGQDIALPNAQNPTMPVAIFAGSGSIWAAHCWNVNRCGRKAIDSAKAGDKFTGGATKFLELDSGNHNLANSISVEQMKTEFLKKGMVMYINSAQQPQPLTTAAANDPKVKELCDRIAQGQATVSAPCDAMWMNPSQQDEDRLDAVLNQIFAAK
ncbi:hypothetical protein PQQ81_26980 [Paraburkholderia strydomiana]|uniref:hypothetical protein n=1 Tax=Paraburkholderia strydomiana TaxID=1245417 RepID=UPI0038BD5B02